MCMKPFIFAWMVLNTQFCIHHMFLLYSLSGGELFDRVAAEDYKMTEAEVIKYIRQVCEGLQHMHEQNIVHLDIKVTQC